MLLFFNSGAMWVDSSLELWRPQPPTPNGQPPHIWWRSPIIQVSLQEKYRRHFFLREAVGPLDMFSTSPACRPASSWWVQLWHCLLLARGLPRPAFTHWYMNVVVNLLLPPHRIMHDDDSPNIHTSGCQGNQSFAQEPRLFVVDRNERERTA